MVVQGVAVKGGHGRNDMGDKVGVIAVASASSGKQVLHRKPKENGYKRILSKYYTQRNTTDILEKHHLCGGGKINNYGRVICIITFNHHVRPASVRGCN